MKNKKIIYLVILIAGCFLWSCKKELNVYPTTSEVDGNVIIDTKSAETVLNGVYYRFADAGADNNQVPTTLWTTVNEVLPSELANSLTSVSGDDGFYTIDFNSKTNGIDYIWDYGYNLVNAANSFIANVTPVAKIPAATKTEMLAEANFYGHSVIVSCCVVLRQYNDPSSKYGIIMRNAPVTSNNINFPRSSVAAAYTSILADLDTAIAALPATNTAIYYANSSAAKLLKARVLINRGAPGDYAEVISLTSSVIASGTFALEDSTKDIFLSKGFASKEVILGVQPFAAQTYKFQQFQYYNQYVASDTLVSLLTNDPRNQWVYKSANTPYFGPLNTITKYYSGDPANIAQTPLAEYSYAFRLSEAYLLEAEAITLSNGDLATAKTLLKTVQGHAGITDFSSVNNTTTAGALQVLIAKEEMRNFVAENGADWFALRRLPLSTITTLQPAITDANKFKLIFPIPYSETSVNNQVIQNPGY